MPEEPCLAARNLFIRRWGEMGASWGISRTMAEIHALLYLSSAPLCTDDVMEQLEISRGNASMNLRQLVHWGLIERVHQRGDRKEYFQAETDVWQIFQMISRERRRRELEPIVETIERCQAMVAKGKSKLRGSARSAADLYQERLDEMLSFFVALNGVFNSMSRLGPDGVRFLASTMDELAGGASTPDET